MRIRKLVPLRIVLAIGLALPALALTQGCGPVIIESYAPEPPPPSRVEIRPAQPGPRFAWQEGHWSWRPGPKRYVWLPGTWARLRHPHHRHWMPGHWQKTARGHRWINGHWR